MKLINEAVQKLASSIPKRLSDLETIKGETRKEISEVLNFYPKIRTHTKYIIIWQPY